MKILVLSFYYPPDLSAGSFRTYALVSALEKQLPIGWEIDIVTTRPNRYQTFIADAPAIERRGPTTVFRIELPPHRSGMIDQARSFAAFGRGAFRTIRKRQYGLVFATSSRLMTAALGAWVARRLRSLLYLDIRDIFVDTMKEVLPRRVAPIANPVLARLERFTISRANKINLVSEGFAPYFRSRYPDKTFSFFTNGIDDEFLANRFAQPGSGRAIRAVLYAGNIGEGQGLHEIIPELGLLTEGRLHFKIIGDGGRRRELEARLNARNVRNVTVCSPMNREQLLSEYRAADVLFLHLNDYEAFKKVLPSKIFEYAATGKPIWAGVGGYSAQFLCEHVDNAAVFVPCDAGSAVEALTRLDPAWTPRTAFVDRFARRTIAEAMATDLVATASRGA